MQFTHFFTATVALAVAMTGTASAAVAPSSPPPVETTTRLIVKFRAGTAAAAAVRGKVRVLSLSGQARVELAAIRDTGTGATVYALPASISLAEARVIASRIALDPAVLYAEPDVRLRTLAEPVPNDPYVSTQWNLQAPTVSNAGGGNFFNAAALVGNHRIVVAVIDTGVLPMPDLVPSLLPGYNFISDPSIANDGDGRDADPTDAGDYCPGGTDPSSWHGLQVATIIAAQSGNGVGTAGASGNVAQIVPVRALGCGGGWMSDIADGLTWASGGSVSGVPVNGSPARVVNMSLGSAAGSPCPKSMQDAVDAAVARGVVVVASSGNDGSTTGISFPASCIGVIAVGAHTKSGDLAAYSNSTPAVALTAPGGWTCRLQTGAACDNSAVPTVSNSGATVASNNYFATPLHPSSLSMVAPFAGTSAAAPHVAAAAAMLLAINPALTPAQVKGALVSSARAPVPGSYCAVLPTACGGGMLDAGAAIGQITAPLLSVTGPTTAVSGSTVVTVSVEVQGSVAPYTYSWTQRTGPPVALTGDGTASVSFTAPATKGPDVSFDVTVQGSTGLSSHDVVAVHVNNKPVVMRPKDSTIVAGTGFNEAVIGTDADGDPVTLALLSAPAGARLADGMLSWPDPAPGSYDVVVEANDGEADSAPVTFKITVVTAAAQSVMASAENTAVTGGGGSASPAFGLLLLAAVWLLRRASRLEVAAPDPLRLHDV